MPAKIGILLLFFIVLGDIITTPTNNYRKMLLSDVYQPSNIYVPGLPGLNVPERTPDSHNLYSDREVAQLPYLIASHPRNLEWTNRIASTDRLVRYLSIHKKAAGILEIGCGNGWLSRRLADVPGSRVIGLDPNLGELRQAARIFRKQRNLKFIYGEFYSDVLRELSFDIIVMAATIQYFPSLPQLVSDALCYLRPHGELHLLDSPLVPTDLKQFRHRYLYNPSSLWNRIRRSSSPHPWVCISAPHPKMS
ncbi:MAG TPA: class I SAM-dependent methyltransferase [Puia sp.]|jgi:SAM-dependent methyltransferase|nr:class I SAM-dependent methyltransferase [Puia sp.]